MSPEASAPTYDLAVIGGGINGCGIARDAAGRGWSVFLCEAGDLASATSSASTKLIHGGLRYLELFDFRLVREALAEREVLWSIAPHIIWPLRFVLPHQKGLRAAWLIRLGLFLYDHFGGRRLLPPTRTLRLRRDPAGQKLKPQYQLAFEYSDCWADDSRLVVLNARDAAEMGANIATYTRCVEAVRAGEYWRVTVRSARTNKSEEIRARALVNAAGPWVGDVLSTILRANAPANIRLVQGSHIVVPRLYPGEHCYMFQNADQRILFAIPYEQDYTLIGTTDRDYTGDPADVKATADEIAYLCDAASQYFNDAVTPEQVVWSYSGVRPLYDDGSPEARTATRDYVLHLDVPAGQPAALSIFGGKLTTYRRLAEAALAQLSAHLPQVSDRAAGWTGMEPLPGGGFAVDGFDREVRALQSRYPFLEMATLRRMVRAYGTRAAEILGAATSPADLGRRFGADLTEAEVRYLVRREWATTAQDVVWRRSKLGLRLTQEEIAAVGSFIRDLLNLREVVA